MKILKLTLKKEPFEVMKTGEKSFEFRRDSKWIRSRLLDKEGNEKEYDLVQYTNGYSKDSPTFYTDYIGFFIAVKDEVISYSNGLVVEVKVGDVVIKNGGVLCEYCEGNGFTIEVEAECCMNSERGSCCGFPNPVQVQVQCKCNNGYLCK